jgi:hypothetical protein
LRAFRGRVNGRIAHACNSPTAFDKNYCATQYILVHCHNMGGHDYGVCTMPHSLHVEMPTPSELTEARNFLCEATILVSDVKSLLAETGNCAMAARLKDIQGRLADEVCAVERLIATTAPGLYH